MFTGLEFSSTMIRDVQWFVKILINFDINN